MLSDLERAAYGAGAAGWKQLCESQQKRIAELKDLLADADLYLGILQLVPSDDDHAASVRDLRQRIAAALRKE